MVRPETVAEAVTAAAPAAKARSRCTRCRRYGSVPAPSRCLCLLQAAW